MLKTFFVEVRRRVDLNLKEHDAFLIGEDSKGFALLIFPFLLHICIIALLWKSFGASGREKNCDVVLEGLEILGSMWLNRSRWAAEVQRAPNGKRKVEKCRKSWKNVKNSSLWSWRLVASQMSKMVRLQLVWSVGSCIHFVLLVFGWEGIHCKIQLQLPRKMASRYHCVLQCKVPCCSCPRNMTLNSLKNTNVEVRRTSKYECFSEINERCLLSIGVLFCVFFYFAANKTHLTGRIAGDLYLWSQELSRHCTAFCLQPVIDPSFLKRCN